MGILKQLPHDLEEVDVIVIGGGTAGSVVASRLSDADRDLSVLVIESRQNNYELPTIVHPILFTRNLAPTSTAASFYQAGQEEKVGNRQLVVPTGSILGGGSSINFMMYTRAQRSDFDAWNMPGWSADDIIPYLKKLETYHGPGSKDTHGDDRPVQISKAAKKLGWPEIEDLQSLDSINGTQRALRFISPDGKRQDAAHAYLHPRLRDGQHPNLHVLVESQVIRVIIDDKKNAVGVEYRPNPRFQDATLARSIRARKTVILSSGTLGTPSVLERSGIGSPEILKRAGIPVISSLPGVGTNYQDHHLLVHSYRTNLAPGETADAIMRGEVSVDELVKTKDPRAGWNAQDVTCTVRPTNAEAAELGPEFQAAWERDFKDKPNKPIALMSLVSGFANDPGNIPVGQFISLTAFTVHPYSRGRIHITGPSVDDPVDFETGFFADPHDLDVRKHIWIYKKQREILRRADVYRGEVAATHPPFPPDSDAACVELWDDNNNNNNNSRLADVVKDIKYTPADDAIIEKWLREHISTTWHSLGTCKMAPPEQGGVVDASLSVYGVQGLKVADLSIAPGNVAANTASTAFAVGERAADIFVAELGLGGKRKDT
ncbi:putative alcohol oxidase [Daldinia caldariorum]|uniref:putative alcohol oxidase n=1 Tax=Daldinia caldariorum TaxID=326644 RepID=UPI002008B28B|nr:putative alcohol oxidase [Daldinia caldariorum]KAI1463231.1 putative alcohol oxidase [Daldinia caldariorum]